MRRIQFHLIKAFIECLLHKRHAAAGVGGPVGKSSDTGQNEIRTIRKRRHKHRAGAKEEGVVRSECFSWIPGKKEPGTKSSPVTLYRGSKSRAEVGSEAGGGRRGRAHRQPTPALRRTRWLLSHVGRPRENAGGTCPPATEHPARWLSPLTSASTQSLLRKHPLPHHLGVWHPALQALLGRPEAQ